MAGWLNLKGRSTVLVAAAASLMVSAGALHASERVGDFALLDHQGYFHHMAWYDNNKAIAFLVQTNGGEGTEAALQTFQASRAAYEDRGVHFMMINPLGEDREAVQQQLAAWSVDDLPVLIDDVQTVSESMGIERTGEAILFDPESFTVLYRGPAGEPFTAALEQVVTGEEVRNAVVASEGESIHYPERDPSTVSYSRDVAPVIAENCADCHRDGGVAPFALDSHAMVQGWSPMIREVLLTKRMPPGQIDPHVGEFENHYTLAVEDQRNILDWIATGSPKADAESDPLAALTWPDTEWKFGEPDLVIEVPEQQIPATGVLDYINVVVPIEGMEKDRWVRASQYVPGDPRVLHHTLNAVLGPNESPRRGLVGGADPNVAYVTPYIPGAQPHHEDPNTGGLLKQGSSIALQLHYTTFGQETVDASRIGIWFYDEENVPQERRTGECACIFTPTWTSIPPYDPNFEMSQHITIEDDAYITAFTPHMHFRGKYMRFEAHYPDGTVEELINIANYNYNWQMEYQMKEPRLVPAGTRIVAIGAFDNSEQNPANPDPSREVPWGDQSWDEMFFGQVYYKYKDQSRYHQDETMVSSSN